MRWSRRACDFRVDESELLRPKAASDETVWSPLKLAAQVVCSTTLGNAAEKNVHARL